MGEKRNCFLQTPSALKLQGPSSLSNLKHPGCPSVTSAHTPQPQECVCVSHTPPPSHKHVHTRPAISSVPYAHTHTHNHLPCVFVTHHNRLPCLSHTHTRARTPRVSDWRAQPPDRAGHGSLRGPPPGAAARPAVRVGPAASGGRGAAALCHPRPGPRAPGLASPQTCSW